MLQRKWNKYSKEVDTVLVPSKNCWLDFKDQPKTEQWTTVDLCKCFLGVKRKLMINNLKRRCWRYFDHRNFSKLSPIHYERAKCYQVKYKTRYCTAKTACCCIFLGNSKWADRYSESNLWFLSIVYFLSVNSILGVFCRAENDKYIYLLTLTFQVQWKQFGSVQTSAGFTLRFPPGNKQELWHLENKKWLFCWSFSTKRWIVVHVSHRLVEVNLYSSAFCPIKVRQSEVQAQTLCRCKAIYACDYSVIQPIIAGFQFCHKGFIQRHPRMTHVCEGLNYEGLAQRTHCFCAKTTVNLKATWFLVWGSWSYQFPWVATALNSHNSEAQESLTTASSTHITIIL